MGSRDKKLKIALSRTLDQGETLKLIVIGEGGSGKTHFVSEKVLPKLKNKTLILTPTHSAKNIMKEKVNDPFVEVKTLASVFKNEEFLDFQKKQHIMVVNGLLTNFLSDYSSIILEEFSMMGKVEVVEVLKYCDRYDKNIILLGDLSQLPPVKKEALSDKNIEFLFLEKGFELIELSHNYRFKKMDKSTVEYIYNVRRNGYRVLNDNTISDAVQIYKNCDKFFNDFIKENDEDKIFIAHKNKNVHKMTQSLNIKKYDNKKLCLNDISQWSIVFFDFGGSKMEVIKYEPTLENGDILFCDKQTRDRNYIKFLDEKIRVMSNYNIDNIKGVDFVAKHNYIKSIWDKYEKNLFYFVINDYKGYFYGFIGDKSEYKTYKKECFMWFEKKLLYFLKDNNIDIELKKRESKKSLENRIIKAYNNINVHKIMRDFNHIYSKYLKMKDCFYVTPHNVRTIHKSQGMTSSTVYADLRGCRDDKLAYVAVSRSSKNLKILL